MKKITGEVIVLIVCAMSWTILITTTIILSVINDSMINDGEWKGIFVLIVVSIVAGYLPLAIELRRE